MSQVNGGGGSGGTTVTSVTGTANQVTAAPTTGAVIVSTPSVFIAPGSIASTTTNTAGTGFLAPNSAGGQPGYSFTSNPAQGFGSDASDHIFVTFSGNSSVDFRSGSTSFNNFTTTAILGGYRIGVTSPGAYPYTTLNIDYVILVNTSAARTINLLAGPNTGQTYIIKDNTGTAGANNITIVPAAGNIDNAANYVISTNNGSAQLVYNGTQWNVIASH